MFAFSFQGKAIQRWFRNWEERTQEIMEKASENNRELRRHETESTGSLQQGE